jgi:hypothetical protein
MDTVPLKEFIKNVLIDVAQGIRDANAVLKNPDKNQYEVFNLRKNKGDYAKIPGIQFDVAVTASAESKTKAGFMVVLVNIGGGASAEKAFGNVLTHRIKFEVGIEDEWK